MSEEKLLAIAEYESHHAFSATERLVLRYADQLTQTPVHVEEHLFGALQQGVSEAQLVELTAAIAWENYRARFNHGVRNGE